MSAEKNVTLNRNSSLFYDQTTGLKIVKGQVIKLNPKQAASRRLKGAINTGHVVYTDKPETKAVTPTPKKPETKKTPEVLKAEMDALLAKEDVTTEEIIKAFKLDDLKILAPLYEVEPEETDTKKDLVEAILETILPEDGEGSEDEEEEQEDEE